MPAVSTPDTATSVAGCPQCGAPRAEGAAFCPVCLEMQARQESPAAPPCGGSVAGFLLERKLGAGGMGEVWLARHATEQRLRAAVKFVRTVASPERFLAERRCLASLTHPHIARIYDAGCSPDGALYMVMEYVEQGLPLPAWCDARQLGIGDRLQLFLQVCRAVQHAHEKSIVHRDLKPDNILVTAGDGQASVRVIDFGIARHLTDGESPGPAGAELAPGGAHTAEGTFVGTWQYASPEQLRGEVVDTRTDIYSLGAVLYELLGGFRCVTPEEFTLLAARVKAAGTSGAGEADQRRRLALALAEHRPSSLAARLREATTTDDPAVLERLRTIAAARALPLRRLPGAVPPDLEAVVVRCLSADPAARYPSPAALAEDLTKWLEHQPVTAFPPRAAYVAGKFLRRHPGSTAAAAALLVSLAGGLAFSLHYAGQERRARVEADTRRTEAALATETAEGLINAMLHDLRDKLEPLGKVDLLDDISRQAQRYYEDRARLGVSERSESNFAAMWENRSEVLQATGHLDEAQAALQNSLSLREEQARQPGAAPRARANLANTLTELSSLAQTQGRHADSRAALQRALSTYETLTRDEPGESKWRNNQAAALLQLSDLDQSEGHLPAAAEAAARAVALLSETAGTATADPDDQSNLAGALTRAGDIALETGDLAAARREFGKASDIYRDLLQTQPEHRLWQTNLALTLLRLADVEDADGAQAAARPGYEEALRMFDALAAHDPGNAAWREDHAGCHQRLGGILESAGDPSAAQAHFTAALAISEELVRLSPGNTRAEGNLAVSLVRAGHGELQQGHTETARGQFDRARKIFERLIVQNPGKTRWHFNLGLLLSVQSGMEREAGDLPAAAACCERQREIGRQLVAATPESPEAAMLLGYACRDTVRLRQKLQPGTPAADLRPILEEGRAPLAALQSAGPLPEMPRGALQALDEALAALE